MIARRLLRTRARRWIALVIAVLVVAAIVVAAWPRSAAAPIAGQDEKITVPAGPGLTGTVTLDAGLYLPAKTPAPAVIVAHGFGGSRMSVDADAQRLANAGFVVLTYSARGFGKSTGRVGLDSLDYEVPDARALVDWLGKQPEVVQDGPDDPRVGVTGGSYGGALALMLAGTDPRIDAVAAVATWNNLQQALFPNNVDVVRTAEGSAEPGAPSLPSAPSPSADTGTPAFVPAGGDGVFKQAWAAALISSVLVGPSAAGSESGGSSAGPESGGPSSAPASSAPATGSAPGSTTGSKASGSHGSSVTCGRLVPDICAAYTQVAESGRITPAMAALLANSSPARVVSHITAPTLLVQGEQDTLFGLGQADANARAIAANGTPVAMTWYAGGHNGGAPDQATEDRITNWLEYYLDGPKKPAQAPSRAFRYSVAGPVSDRGKPRLRTLQLPGYPGLDGAPRTPEGAIRLSGPPQVIANPPGGVPAALTSLPGLSSLASSLAPLTAVPGQTADFLSAPMTASTVISGSARITLSVLRVSGAQSAGATASEGTTHGGTAESGSADGTSVGSGSPESPSAGSDSEESTPAESGSAPAAPAEQAQPTEPGLSPTPPPSAAPSAVLYLSLASVPGTSPPPGTPGGPPSSAASAPASAGAPAGTDLTAAASALAAAPAGGAVAPIRVPLPPDGSPATITVSLPAVAFQVVSGNRLMLRVATTDQGYFGPKTPAAYRVSLVDNGTLTTPEAGGTRLAGGDDAEPVGLAIGLAALALLAIVALAVAGRVRPRGRPGSPHGRGQASSQSPSPAPPPPPHSEAPTPDAAGDQPPAGPAPASADATAPKAPTPEPPSTAHGAADAPDADDAAPLVISGLNKRYPGGVVAVEHVDLRVERGQVLGLLGPNGAGKTTTLRMVMGLIMPTVGAISIFGEPAGPGAPVLSRIGSFVEGSGFLPHLPGRTNLELYWRATGRPAADAHLAEALEIADLGTAIRRKVKTYSQGMRQRLAIAQAMLGLPDLLILDEPTNGLDPPQIHAMREVLRRYAATGRTVVISSHLLSEVEQTCSHVVVMSRGRTIAAGTVAQMVAASGEMSIGTTDPEAAAACVSTIDGIGEIEATTAGIAVDLGEASLGAVLKRLLDAGITVTSAAPRNRLEDVFLELVGSATAGSGGRPGHGSASAGPTDASPGRSAGGGNTP